MSVPIRQNLVSSDKYSIKAPNAMTPRFITVHNTANDASAENEIAYMIRNNNEVSFHFAVDDKEAIQGLPLNRNGWHAGDGANGTGNRQSIGVEICYSKSGGNRFTKAEQNGAWLVAKLMRDHNISLDNVRTHQMWNGKYCPHRTLDLGWQRFLNMVQSHAGGSTSSNNSNNNSNMHTLTQATAGYTTASDALNGRNPRTTVSPGTYHIFNTSQGMVNVTSKQGTPGSWINPNASTSNVSYYPTTNPVGGSIVNTLNSIGVDSSFANCERIARANGISNYTGSSSQNTQLLNLLRQGKLKRP